MSGREEGQGYVASLEQMLRASHVELKDAINHFHEL
jgi:hypothetical protein